MRYRNVAHNKTVICHLYYIACCKEGGRHIINYVIFSISVVAISKNIGISDLRSKIGCTLTIKKNGFLFCIDDAGSAADAHTCRDWRRGRRYARVRPSGRVRWADGASRFTTPFLHGCWWKLRAQIRNGTTPQGVMRDACGRGWSALNDSLAPTIESRETPCSEGKWRFVGKKS